jgi:hypothetical protein
LGIGLFTGVAVAPLGIMFGAVLIIGIGLNLLDNHFEVKNKVLATFKALPAKFEQGVYRLQQDGLPTLEQMKRAADQQLMQITNAANKAANKAIDKTLDAAVNQVLNQLNEAIKRVLGPRLR